MSTYTVESFVCGLLHCVIHAHQELSWQKCCIQVTVSISFIVNNPSSVTIKPCGTAWLAHFHIVHTHTAAGVDVGIVSSNCETSCCSLENTTPKLHRRDYLLSLQFSVSKRHCSSYQIILYLCTLCFPWWLSAEELPSQVNQGNVCFEPKDLMVD